MRCLAAFSFLLPAVLAAQTSSAPPRSYPTLGKIVREDPRLDQVLDPSAKIEVLATGFEWSEGPAWDRKNNYLIFSDIPRNSVIKWTRERGAELFMKPSGYTGVADYGREPGSNGLMFDPQGRLYLAEHGDRRVSRMDPEGGKVTLAAHYQGKRLNSPNDLALKSNGDVYFTDPPYGLPKGWDDPRRELDFCGIYRWSAATGEVTLLARDLDRPNGIAFSPDEKTLYVAQSAKRAIWNAYPVKADGTLGEPKVFADVSAEMGRENPGAPDGLKVDRAGNVWATGPGGVHIFAPDGKRLGRILTGEATANVAFGGPDGSVLYITADMYLCRVQTKVRGWE
ncbi:MAG: SMP-30/gluconolactonase/LRE family protein [Bryobacteraceae bacterium]|nr:SMP-30/gluconolactonase/LRE family protein [Bryobacteraceae bacterium]